MFLLFYNLATLLLFPALLAFHLFQLLAGKNPPALAERLGAVSAEQMRKIRGRKVIWVHAVSVGETLAARPLLKALKERRPDWALVVSNTTATGRAVSAGIPEIDAIVCFPFDFLPSVRHALGAVAPELVVIMETEIWPNFTREAARRGIPVVLANGRISERSFPRYRKFDWFFRPTLRLFSLLCMQAEGDLERVLAIGAPPERSVVTGNLKYDVPYREVPAAEKAQLRGEYRIPASATVICAGSTRPGEEAYLLASYQELKRERDDLFLVLAPRHPERTAEIAALLERDGFAYRRCSALDGWSGSFAPGEVLLVDGVGQLMRLYALSDLCFVGGSLVELGGHNLLEPASCGIPSTFGPYMNNFRDIAALVQRYRGGVQVPSPEQLTAVWRELLGDPDRRQELGRNALCMMRENGGATARHMALMDRFLDELP